MTGEDGKRDGGIMLEAEIDLVESLGSDLYTYFHVESEGVQSEQLADLVAERLEETGAPDVEEGREQIVARLDPASKIKRREHAQLWADTSKLHLFDAESGESLTQSS
jgi:multiple sugar transport system ATP-binding protein